MRDPICVLSGGLRVRTNATLEPTTGMMVGLENLRQRRPDAEGEIRGPVPGHGGDVYWVQHGIEPMLAPYCFTEFEKAEP